MSGPANAGEGRTPGGIRPVAREESAGLLQAFCVRLKRLQAASGLSQIALARHVGLGKSQVSAILNGGIKRLPDWDIVHAVLKACMDHAAKTGRSLPSDLHDAADWRRRYADLERDVIDAYLGQRSAGGARRRSRGGTRGTEVDRTAPNDQMGRSVHSCDKSDHAAKATAHQREPSAHQLLRVWLERLVETNSQRPSWVRAVGGPPDITRTAIPHPSQSGLTVVLGEAGSGKTCWLRAQVTHWAKEAIHLVDTAQRPAIPLLVHAGDLAARLKREHGDLPARSTGDVERHPCALTIEECLDSTVSALPFGGRPLLLAYLLSALRSEEANFIVAIDAIDEAGEQNIRMHLLSLIEAWRRVPGTVIVITARSQPQYASIMSALVDENKPDARICLVPPLQHGELERLAEAWLGPRQASEWVERLSHAPAIHSSIREQSSSGISMLAASVPRSIMYSPMLSSFAFAVMMESHPFDAPTPQPLPSVDSIYYKIVRRLLRHEWKDEQLVEQESHLDTRLNIIAEIAFGWLDISTKSPPTADEIRRQLSSLHFRGVTNALPGISEVASPVTLGPETKAFNPILLGAGGEATRIVHWSHPSLASWLAAYHLSRTMSVHNALAWLRARWWHDSAWQEVAVFYSGRLDSPSALFDVLEADGASDPLAVIDQLAVRCAAYLQVPSRARTAMRRLLALAEPRSIESTELYRAVFYTISHTYVDEFSEQYRAILVSDRFQFHEAVEEENPIAIELLERFLFDRKAGPLSPDAGALIDGAEKHLRRLDDAGVIRVARTLGEMQYESLDDLRVSSEVPPAYRLTNAVALELRRRGQPRLAWQARTCFLPYHVEALLSVGDVANAYNVMLDEPFDEGQALRPDFDEYIWDVDLSKRLATLASQHEHPLILRIVMAVGAALINESHVEWALLEGLLAELSRGLDLLWDAGLDHFKPLIRSTDDALGLVESLVFLTPDLEYFPSYDNIGGDFHDEFLFNLQNEEIVPPPLNSDVMLVLDRIEEYGLSEILTSLQLLREAVTDNSVLADLEEGEEKDVLDSIRRVFPFVEDPGQWECFNFLHLYYQGKIDAGCIIGLVELCLRIADRNQLSSIADLIERLILNPLFPIRYRILCILFETRGHDRAVELAQKIMSVSLLGEPDSGVSSLFYMLAHDHRSMIRSEKYTGLRDWWNWKEIGNDLLGAAVSDWSPTQWRKAYQESSRRGFRFTASMFEGHMAEVFPSKELTEFLSNEAPAHLLDTRLNTLAFLDPLAAKPWVESLFREHLRECKGWPFCAVIDLWPRQVPPILLGCADENLRADMAQHSRDFSIDAGLGDARALRKLIRLYRDAANGTLPPIKPGDNEYKRKRDADQIKSILQSGWARAASINQEALEALAANAIRGVESGLLWTWCHVAPIASRQELEAALDSGTLQWSDKLANELLRLGSVRAWRWIIDEYIKQQRQGSSLRSIWYHVSHAHLERTGEFFVELAEAAAGQEGGECLAPSLYEAWQKIGQQLTYQEAQEIRELLTPVAGQLRAAFVKRRNHS
jgi:transcriptional regulator with XRE-family HTH domain